MTVAILPPIVSSLRPQVQPSITSSIKPITTTLSNLFKNKGVQAGIGLGAIGSGISFLSSQTKEVTQPFGEMGNSVFVIALVFVILLVVFKR